MRDILVLAIIFGSVPVSLVQPWIGILVFSWVSYMNPHRYAWGMAREFPVAMTVALTTLLGLVATRDRWPLPKARETWLLVMLWGLFTFTTFFAINEAAAWKQWEKVSKIFVMTFATLVLINEPVKLRYLLLVIAGSIGLLGLKGAIFSAVTGGQYRVYGPPGSFLANNGDFALAVNMTLPLLFYLAKTETRRWLGIALKVCFVASIFAVVFTFSRGGFLGLCAVGFLLLVKGQRKTLAAIVLVLGIVVVASVVPQKWTDRMHTISEYEQDGSAQGRINAWRTAANLALDRPFTGGGFETFIGRVFAVYSPDPRNVRDVHSIYFEILGEHGFIALGLYMGLIASCFLTLRGLKKNFARNDSMQWARSYPEMIEVSMAAYMVGGAFLGQAYFDLFYHLVAVVIILKTLALRQIRAATQTAGGQVPVPAGSLGALQTRKANRPQSSSGLRYRARPQSS